ISGGGAASSDNVGLGTIIDDDASPGLSIANSSSTEGSAASFTITLNAASGQNVTFNYATSDGTASSASDYTAIGSTALTILAGATAATITVNTTSDASAEGDETYTVPLSSPVNATLITAAATGTIINDDPPTISTLANSSALNLYNTSFENATDTLTITGTGF